MLLSWTVLREQTGIFPNTMVSPPKLAVQTGFGFPRSTKRCHSLLSVP